MGRRPEGTFGQAPKHAGFPKQMPAAAPVRPELDVERLYQMGRAAITAHQPDAAVEALERVICLQPDHVDALTSLVHAHVAAGNQKDAQQLIAMLRARKPDTPMADFEEARLLSDLGQIEQARALLEGVTRKHPSYAPAWHALAKLGRVHADDPLIGRICSLLGETAEPSANMMFLCLALSKIYDDIGEYDLAFDHQLRAKAQIPAPYNREQEQFAIDGVRNVFTSSFFSKRRDFGVESKRPIFVVGLPRSGTSLVEQILASHADVFGAGEIDFLAGAAGEVSALTVDSAPLARAALKLGREASSILGLRYLRRVSGLNRTHARVVDKLPHNFLRIGLIGLILPGAAIVHCAREPIDNCLSIFMQYFAQDHAYAHDLQALGHYYQLYAGLMAHWHEHTPTPIHNVVNQALVRDQRGETERLVAHVGLDWDERMMAFHETDRRVATPSRMQVRAPLNSRSLGRWRPYAHRLEPLIEALGPYAPTS